MELKILIVLHTIGAAIWVGGHLVLLLTFVPEALKSGDPEVIRFFEKRYERIGIPALLVQLVTGLRMAWIHLPDVSFWFDWSQRLAWHVDLKLVLLMLTLALGIHARFFLIPKLTSANLGALALHIGGINILGLLLLVTGLSIRYSIF